MNRYGRIGGAAAALALALMAQPLAAEGLAGRASPAARAAPRRPFADLSPIAAPAPLAPDVAAAPALAPIADAPVAAGGVTNPTGSVNPTGPVRDPNRGAVTNLPLPRYVSLKTGQGNARRGPGLTHRIDWVFTQAGMPLRITAEHEHWRRIEDAEGAGGWVHYALLSGVRSVLIAQDIAELRSQPDPKADPVMKAGRGVIGWIVSCNLEWCRVKIDGTKAWLRKTALWGVEPDELIE